MQDPGLLSLLPIIVAIGLALLTKRVVLSLFSGVLTAALVASAFHPWQALLHTADPMILDVLADRDNAKVVLFSLLIAATVSLMSKGQGTAALVGMLSGLARGRRRGQLATWLAGMVVFFDDYANCLIVGSSMRPLSDRLGISREKLAYIVDSTAAPVATLALVSTWVGYEVGLMDQGLQAAGLDESAYGFFIEGLPYRFYPLLALVMVVVVAATGRDFGPMAAAEARAHSSHVEALVEAPSARLAWLAVVPIVALVGGTMASLWVQGSAAVPEGARLFEVIGAADGYDAMMHGSLAAWVLAILLAAALRVVPITEAFEVSVEGMKDLFVPLVVLYLAWGLGSGIKALGAADTLVSLLGPWLPAVALPSAVFVVSAGIAFATGTSFGTMAVLVPLVIPLAANVGADRAILLATSSAVLSGATWGDHCSPISDTTVLSSTGAGCDLQAHVSTQLPYAIVAGGISMLVGTIPAGFGVSPWLSLLLGAVAIFSVVWVAGRLPPSATS